MAYSYQSVVSNGTLTNLLLTIDYTSRSEISVYFDGVLSTAWSWVGTTEKQITFSPAVPAGVTVLVRRTTDIAAPKHVFSSGAQFKAVAVDENTRQLLNAAQESRETATYRQLGVGEVANVKDFGAVGNGLVDDTAAIQAALSSAVDAVYIPSGVYSIRPVAITNARIKLVYGDGASSRLVALGTIADYAHLLSSTAATDLTIRDLALRVPKGTYPAVYALYLANQVRARVSGVYVEEAGLHGVFLSQCARVVVDNCNLRNCGGSAISCENNSSMVTIDCNYIETDTVVGRGINIVDCGDCNVTGNQVRSVGSGAGILVTRAYWARVLGNSIYTTWAVGIGFVDAGLCSISDNDIECAGTHQDHAIYLQAVSRNCGGNQVIGNTTYMSGKAGISISASSGVLNATTIVTANNVHSPNQTNETAADLGSAIRLYGGAGCTENVITNNNCVDYTSKMRYAVSELNDGTSGNIIGPNPSTGTSMLAETNRRGPTTRVTDSKVTTYTPAVTALSGTITSASAVVHWRRSGEFVYTSVVVTVTDNGTGADGVTILLPESVARGVLSGRANFTTGKGLTARAVGNVLTIKNYDNTYPAANGCQLELTGVLELM